MTRPKSKNDFPQQTLPWYIGYFFPATFERGKREHDVKINTWACISGSEARKKISAFTQLNNRGKKKKKKNKTRKKKIQMTLFLAMPRSSVALAMRYLKSSLSRENTQTIEVISQVGCQDERKGKKRGKIVLEYKACPVYSSRPNRSSSISWGISLPTRCQDCQTRRWRLYSCVTSECSMGRRRNK